MVLGALIALVIATAAGWISKTKLWNDVQLHNHNALITLCLSGNHIFAAGAGNNTAMVD